jgi:TetR/AcrR family transcriptional regulator, transcriptional repressor of bet genes
LAQPPKYNRLTSAERKPALIEAGFACLARGGILAFTIDNVCKEAGVSRGLITHHFKSKDGLLVAIYRAMYERMLTVIETAATSKPRLLFILDTLFAPDLFSRDELNIWLALWSEIVNNPALKREHRRQYTRYRRAIETAFAEFAAQRGVDLDVKALSQMLIALVDGLGLERCIAPKLLSPRAAKQICLSTLERLLGPLVEPMFDL